MLEDGNTSDDKAAKVRAKSSPSRCRNWGVALHTIGVVVTLRMSKGRLAL